MFKFLFPAWTRLRPLAACAAASWCTSAAADPAVLTPFSGAALGDPPAVWKYVSLPKKIATKFTVVELGGAHVMKVEAVDSYGNLVHAVHHQATEATELSWRWRVDQLTDAADLTTRAGDDSPAKICVFFAFDASQLSLGERTKLSVAQSLSGQDVPTESLCYVWDNKLAVDTAMANAFTKRVRFIVLDSGTAKLGQWVSQRRHVVADYLKLFGDEAQGKVPEITGVAISADADNTHGHMLSYFGDVQLSP